MVSRETYLASHYFDLSEIWFAPLFSQAKTVWEILRPKFKEEWISREMKANVAKVHRDGTMVTKTTEIRAGSGIAIVEAGSFLIGNEIELRRDVVIEAGAWVTGPTILGEGTTVRHGAYVRGGVLTGTRAVIGHTTEVKSAIFLNHAKAPHFAYVGDSILGNHVNLGAGTKLSNLKITNDEIVLRIGDQRVKTGLRKMGAIIGDGSETGCNSVLNPGVLLGKGCLVYPAVAVRKNYYEPKTAIKG
jgi:NDP-sugar pyrophosphorylase family protein